MDEKQELLREIMYLRKKNEELKWKSNRLEEKNEKLRNLAQSLGVSDVDRAIKQMDEEDKEIEALRSGNSYRFIMEDE